MGPTGPAGPAGPGVAPGGTAGQVLTKVNSTNFNTTWKTPSTGGGGSLTPCTSADKRCGVFSTQMLMTGDLVVTNPAIGFTQPTGSPHAVADAICQFEGERIVPGSTWRAWLSDSSANAGTYTLQPGTRYMRNGTGVNIGTAEQLVMSRPSDIHLGATINSNGAPSVWTGTEGTGNIAALTCNDWSTNSFTSGGIVGNTGSVTVTWTNDLSNSCDTPQVLFCFQRSA